MLTFDANACCNALIQRLIEVSNDLIKEFYREATGPLSSKAKADTKINAAHITDKTENTDYQGIGQFVTSSVEFYANALIESFGMGSGADTGADSYWAEYRRSFGFNDARSGSTIVGRGKGTYQDIWGNTRYSEGTNRGKKIEGLKLFDYLEREEHEVQPIHEKHSIQNAENWIVREGSTKIERRVQMEIEKFLSEEASKYFVEVGD